DGRSIHTVQLTVYEWNETRQRWQVVSDTELSQIYFQDPENYIVGQLNTGVYRLCINATGWGVDGNGERFVTCYGDTDNVELATDIAVTYGQATTGIDFVLEDRAAGRIEGTVLADGAPQSGVEVELYAVDQDTTTWWRMVYVETDTDGRYRIDGLESGEYRVRFVDPNDVFTSIVYGGGFSIETGQSIVLETGAVMADVDANLLVFDEQIYLPLVTR
ncbi:MAG: carboxypeptidase regulatory-like domain-containing protein, partial [Leptospiraceae bacterium]|nr:carboxypeptidase regulatory-like domain-containing protein [Leptospiraceae bacterium]